VRRGWHRRVRGFQRLGVAWLWCTGVLLSVALTPSALRAYAVHTSLTHGCHEDISADALTDLLADGHLDTSQVPLPARQHWRGLADEMLPRSGLHLADERERFVAFSLLVGSRFPDLQGVAISHTQSMYINHADPSDQHEHFLRAPQHDGPAGDVAAVDVAVRSIEERVAKALHPNAPIIYVDEYVDFYGAVSVAVWAPAFYLGHAMHTLQDSFSHTVRSADLHRIYHVTNFVDAVSAHYDEARDGMAHSMRMDDCTDKKNAPIVRAATLASRDFLDALVDPDWRFAAFADTWLTHEPGCTMQNDFCDSPWTSLARREPVGPILTTFVDCAIAPGVTGSGAATSAMPPLLMAMLVGLGVLGARRWLRSARSTTGPRHRQPQQGRCERGALPRFARRVFGAGACRR